MKLAAKGRFAPPPTLPKHAQSVSETLATWPQVHARTHWLLGDETEIDGADFYVGQDEIGHLHLDGDAHVAVNEALREVLVAAGAAKPFRWSRGFVVYRIRTAQDAAHALRLFALAYDRRRGVAESELLARARDLRSAGGSAAPSDASARRSPGHSA